MHAIRTTPGARSLFALSVAARLPAAMVTIALLVHARHLTGSFAAAGLVVPEAMKRPQPGPPALGPSTAAAAESHMLRPSLDLRAQPPRGAGT
jgi:hypothetical protein